MQITERLIERFLNGRCTADEGEFVSAYFRNNPGALNEYLGGSWNEEGEDALLPASFDEIMLSEIRQKLFRVPVAEIGFVRRHPYGRLVAVAASVLLCLCAIWLYKLQNASRPVPGGMAINHLRKTMKAGAETETWQMNENRTDQKLKMRLTDGSLVTLLPHSSIRFAKNFGDRASEKRDIFLKGHAVFDVAKEKNRPFTVYAGHIATLVLGTSFSVQENEQMVWVKLYSGKIKVRAAEPGLASWKNDIVLKPGEQLRYETGKWAKLSLFEKGLSGLKKPAVSFADHRDLLFDHMALNEVMDQLSRYYQVPIEYKKNELSDMFFSGSVLKTDSLSVILKVIAHMNDLQISLTNEGFRVHSSKN
jgi:ferric-dicitrate binding protein FerR (iron transport regulator)